MSRVIARPKKLGHLKATKMAVLMRYQEVGRIDKAFEVVGLHRRNHYEWLDRDPEYKAQFEKARKAIVQLLEDEAWRRAVEGVNKPTTVAGKRVTIREYSDTLLIFLLKGAAPEKYRERYEHAISGPNGDPIQIEHRAYDLFRGRILSAAARLEAGANSESDQAQAS